MSHAIEILAALDKSFQGRRDHGSIRGADYDIVWAFGPRRMNDGCKLNVLTIHCIELAEEIRGTGVLTEVIERLRTGDPAPRIPLRYLMFQECGPGLSRLLERLKFKKYIIGHTIDFWTPITGQKELGL